MATAQELAFSSDYSIDKIVAEGTVTLTNSGVTSDYATARINTDTIPNTYGLKCFARFVWSLDGGGYNSADTRISYSYIYDYPGPGSDTLFGLRAAVAVGVSASTITFQTANGDHGTVVDNGISITYTPVSHTFTIKYTIYEVQ